MGWKEQMDRAVDKVRTLADSDQVKAIVANARETSGRLVTRAREGALDTAQAFVEANTDPSSVRVSYLNASVSIVSPADGLQISVPHAGTLVIADAAGNGIVVNASSAPGGVAEMTGVVRQVTPNTYDLGAEDGVNVVVLKD